MATNCEDVSAQMMELLYGELPSDARASVDAHVAGCARCRAELDGFEKTRAVARQALDEAPPARVRASILQAAAAHLATQAQAQPAAAAAGKPAPQEKVSFWERLRVRWTLPTFATVGAVAVFMLANRVFLNPERTLEHPAAVQAVQDVPAIPAVPAPSGQPAWKGTPPTGGEGEARSDRHAQRLKALSSPAEFPAADEKPTAPSDRAADKSPSPKGGDGIPAREHEKSKKKAGPAAPFAEPPPPKVLADDESRTRTQPMAAKPQFAPPPPPREEAAATKQKRAEKSPMGFDADEGPARNSVATRAPARRDAPAKEAQALDSLLNESARGRSGGGATSSSPAVGSIASQGKTDGFGSGAARAATTPAPRPVMEPAPAAPAAAPVTASAPPPPPPPAQLNRSRTKREAAAEEGDAASLEIANKDEKKGGKNAASESLMQRADRLFADGRWAEAAAIYRELLRRDPRNEDAERWRRRLVAAENAEVNEQRNGNVTAAKRAAPAADESRAAEAPKKPAASSKASKKADKAAAASDANQ